MIEWIIKHKDIIQIIIPILTFITTVLYLRFTYILIHNPYRTFLEIDIKCTSSNDIILRNKGSFAIKIDRIRYFESVQNFHFNNSNCINITHVDNKNIVIDKNESKLFEYYDLNITI